MNGGGLRPPPGGFEDRLEAELVKVVTARAARPGGATGQAGLPRQNLVPVAARFTSERPRSRWTPIRMARST
jgi:hypothetical protein